MKAVSKILKILLVFFMSLGLIAVVWYAIELTTLEKDETAVPLVDFILYLLGFGDINSKDHYLQTAFSTLGLFAVTLLSSVFTVNLFDLRSKVKIIPKIIIKGKNQALLKFRTSGKDVYNLTATLISKCGKDVTTEEQVFPFVAKKSLQEIYFEIVPGTPIYKYLRASYLKTDSEPQLILTLAYTDVESGQEYSMAQKYQYSTENNQDVIFCDNSSEKHDVLLEKAVKELIEANTFYINLASVWACEAEDIDISYGYSENEDVYSQKQAFSANIHMNSKSIYEPKTFTMAVTSDLLENNWSIYYDLGCALKFDYKIEGDIAVTLELKYGTGDIIKYEQILRPTNEFETYMLSLKDLNREDLKSVKELCFTVFYKDVNPDSPVGNFVIKTCVLEVE